MERNHAASRALLVQLDRKSITDLDDLNEELWVSINSTQSETYRLELIDDGVVSLEFIVKLLVKLGFSCEDSIRLMMKAHKDGNVVLARAEEDTLLNLKSYISTQAKNHGHTLQARIIKI